MTDTVTTVPNSSATGDLSTGTTATPNVKFVTPEDFDGFKSFLNKDLAGHRKELGSLASKFDEFTKSIESRLPPPPPPADDKTSKSLPNAELDRKVTALSEELQQERREKADALITTAITEAISGTVPEVRNVLAKAIRVGARIEKVDGANVVVVDGESGPERLTEEWVRKSQGDYWFPASGKPGTGLTGGGSAATSGVDVDRAMRDQAYFDANRPAVLAELDRRRKAGG